MSSLILVSVSAPMPTSMLPLPLLLPLMLRYLSSCCSSNRQCSGRDRVIKNFTDIIQIECTMPSSNINSVLMHNNWPGREKLTWTGDWGGCTCSCPFCQTSCWTPQLRCRCSRMQYTPSAPHIQFLFSKIVICQEMSKFYFDIYTTLSNKTFFLNWFKKTHLRRGNRF